MLRKSAGSAATSASDGTMYSQAGAGAVYAAGKGSACDTTGAGAMNATTGASAAVTAGTQHGSPSHAYSTTGAGIATPVVAGLTGGMVLIVLKGAGAVSETVVATAALAAAGGADAKGRSRSHQTRRRCRREGQPTFMPSSGAKPSHRAALFSRTHVAAAPRPTAVRGPIDRIAMSSVVSWHGPFLSTAGLNTTRVISSHVRSPQQGHANRGAAHRMLSLSWRPAPRRDSPRAPGTAKPKSALKPGRCKFRNFLSCSLCKIGVPASSSCAKSNERELCGHDRSGSGSRCSARGSLLLNDRRCGRNLRLLGCHGWQHHRRRGCKRSRIEAAEPLERCSSGEPSR